VGLDDLRLGSTMGKAIIKTSLLILFYSSASIYLSHIFSSGFTYFFLKQKWVEDEKLNKIYSGDISILESFVLIHFQRGVDKVFSK